jgi:hypothetical protein
MFFGFLLLLPRGVRRSELFHRQATVWLRLPELLCFGISLPLMTAARVAESALHHGSCLEFCHFLSFVYVFLLFLFFPVSRLFGFISY